MNAIYNYTAKYLTSVRFAVKNRVNARQQTYTVFGHYAISAQNADFRPLAAATKFPQTSDTRICALDVLIRVM
jgi:hypothetical protein